VVRNLTPDLNLAPVTVTQFKVRQTNLRIPAPPPDPGALLVNHTQRRRVVECHAQNERLLRGIRNGKRTYSRKTYLRAAPGTGHVLAYEIGDAVRQCVR